MARESALSKTVSDFLQLMVNAGRVIWHDRLNSGGIKAVIGGRPYWMHLCKKGTPDRYAILSDGLMLWLEIKPPGGTIEAEQIQFHEMIMSTPNHEHLFVKDIDEVRRWFDARYDSRI